MYISSLIGRIKVALVAANAFSYLHNPEEKVDYNAKLCILWLAKDGPLDGNSRVSTQVIGTNEYAAPGYIATNTDASSGQKQPYKQIIVVTSIGLVIVATMHSRFMRKIYQISLRLRLLDMGRPLKLERFSHYVDTLDSTGADVVKVVIDVAYICDAPVFHVLAHTKKQPTVALSSCESEFMAATGAACQALWLKRLLSELTGWKEERITLKVDNVSAIALVRNPVFRGRSKHIDIRYHFIRECVENGHINVEHVSGELQRVDILTKALPRLKFVTMRQMLRVQDLGRSNDRH
nr:zinc finger, CCHC-type [Tanacetum cinerariifolium]